MALSLSEIKNGVREILKQLRIPDEQRQMLEKVVENSLESNETKEPYAQDLEDADRLIRLLEEAIRRIEEVI